MIVLPLSWILMPQRNRWKLFMIAASYFFYGYWNWRFVFLIAASSIFNWAIGGAIFRRTFEPVGALDFAVYLSFFPHVVAGPIVRAAEFLPQLRERHDPRRIDASRAFFLIFIGLFKKVVIANFLATEIVDRVFASPTRHSSLEMLVGIYGYAVQIYCDFSGYTDMAIGIALLLGFRFPQNFDSPYSATSLQDFWRRWHMTLSRWLRDYIYIPLGGNRGGEAR